MNYTVDSGTTEKLDHSRKIYVYEVKERVCIYECHSWNTMNQHVDDKQVINAGSLLNKAHLVPMNYDKSYRGGCGVLE